MFDDVRGTIIGGERDGNRYTFHDRDGVQITGAEWFTSDRDAIAWFQSGWPERFKQGAEMRCWN